MSTERKNALSFSENQLFTSEFISRVALLSASEVYNHSSWNLSFTFFPQLVCCLLACLRFHETWFTIWMNGNGSDLIQKFQVSHVLVKARVLLPLHITDLWQRFSGGESTKKFYLWFSLHKRLCTIDTRTFSLTFNIHMAEGERSNEEIQQPNEKKI